MMSTSLGTCGNGVHLLLQAWDADDPSKGALHNFSSSPLAPPVALAWIHQGICSGDQLQAKDDCWCIEALYKWQPNKMHSKEMQYMKVHHEEVHHEEMHHEMVQLKLQQHKRRCL